MKFSNSLILILCTILITGCGMYTKGQPIENGLPTKQALLVLDIQNDFVEPNAKLPVQKDQADIMISNANLLITAFSSDNKEIVYIGNEYKSSDKIANWFRKGAAIEGTQGAQISKRINVVGKAYFPKSHPDAFSNVLFDKYLRDNRITEVVIVGVFADQCVLSTVRGAIQRGYSVVTVSDAMAVQNNKTLSTAIVKHQKSGSRVANTDDVLARLKEN